MSISRSGLQMFPCTLMSVHQHELMHIHRPLPLTLPEPLVLSAHMTLKPSRHTSESGNDLSSHVLVRAMTHTYLNDDSTRHLACSMSILFLNERTLERIIWGKRRFERVLPESATYHSTPTSFPLWPRSYFGRDHEVWVQLTVDGVLEKQQIVP